MPAMRKPPRGSCGRGEGPLRPFHEPPRGFHRRANGAGHLLGRETKPAIGVALKGYAERRRVDESNQGLVHLGRSALQNSAMPDQEVQDLMRNGAIQRRQGEQWGDGRKAWLRSSERRE